MVEPQLFPSPGHRWPLDALLGCLEDHAFVTHFRRHPSFRDTSPHVNPLMLASSGNESLYVRAWRRHAEQCPACGRLFAYFDLS